MQKNLLVLHTELKTKTYLPKPLTAFIIRDPKTRLIHKSDFRDRVIHHALVQIIEPLFDRTFIYDSYANRIGKGTLKAIARFNQFARKVSRNGSQKGWFNNNQIKGYCLKVDIKHYFQTVDCEILLSIIKKKITCQDTINLIEIILKRTSESREREINIMGMPLGNLTSQFLANVYLNELDQFIKHQLKCKYYIRYVDDFVILHESKEQLAIWKEKISIFLKGKLKLELHQDKSKIISLSKGIDFVGFRNFWKYKLLRRRNIRNMQSKIDLYKKGEISFSSIYESFNGWKAYSKWANCHNLNNKIKRGIIDILWEKF